MMGQSFKSPSKCLNKKIFFFHSSSSSTFTDSLKHLVHHDFKFLLVNYFFHNHRCTQTRWFSILLPLISVHAHSNYKKNGENKRMGINTANFICKRCAKEEEKKKKKNAAAIATESVKKKQQKEAVKWDGKKEMEVLLLYTMHTKQKTKRKDKKCECKASATANCWWMAVMRVKEKYKRVK